MHAVTALDSSGETAKQVAESKKWLAIAALIPDQSPNKTTSALPHPDNNRHPVLVGNHPSTTTSVRQLDQPQPTTAQQQLSAGAPSTVGMPPQQLPAGCSTPKGSIDQMVAASASATEAPVPSSHRSTGLDAAGPAPPCQAGSGPQQQPVWQPTQRQDVLSGQLSISADRPAPTDAGASTIDVQPPQSCPTKAEGKA
ncbi:hypothetical protein ABBQ32_004558 [Trebouxia sp. C0010 RCD-2024]